MACRVLAAALVLLCRPALGATLRVPSEYAAIHEALDAAAFGDTVLVAPGTYTNPDTRVVDLGTGPFTATLFGLLSDGVVVLSEGGPDVTILDLAGPVDRISPRVRRWFASVGDE